MGARRHASYPASKSTQQPMTVVELRDPARLGNSIVIFLDGPAGPLEAVEPGAEVTPHLEEVRSSLAPWPLDSFLDRNVAADKTIGFAGHL